MSGLSKTSEVITERTVPGTDCTLVARLNRKSSFHWLVSLKSDLILLSNIYFLNFILKCRSTCQRWPATSLMNCCVMFCITSISREGATEDLMEFFLSAYLLTFLTFVHVIHHCFVQDPLLKKFRPRSAIHDQLHVLNLKNHL